MPPPPRSLLSPVNLVASVSYPASLSKWFLIKRHSKLELPKCWKLGWSFTRKVMSVLHQAGLPPCTVYGFLSSAALRGFCSGPNTGTESRPVCSQALKRLRFLSCHSSFFNAAIDKGHVNYCEALASLNINNLTGGLTIGLRCYPLDNSWNQLL